jgi:hypothetical protein
MYYIQRSFIERSIIAAITEAKDDYQFLSKFVPGMMPKGEAALQIARSRGVDLHSHNAPFQENFSIHLQGCWIENIVLIIRKICGNIEVCLATNQHFSKEPG